VKQYGVDREATLQSYEPFAQQPYNNLVIVIRLAAPNNSSTSRATLVAPLVELRAE
jgi:hypothetical protein